ncbi:MAG: hypothetical protein U9N43_03930 [Euryarchaeota archaeon]|nr:hypothetical protein [Euryarchaeota archaeon]
MKQTRSVLLAAILLLSMMMVFAGTAAADDKPDGFFIYGVITDENGDPIIGCKVVIEKKNTPWGDWQPLEGFHDTTNDKGQYWMVGWPNRYGDPADDYRMYVGGYPVVTKYIGDEDWKTCDVQWATAWHHRWDYPHIPEFATIAIPAIALLGLFASQRRKQEK